MSRSVKKNKIRGIANSRSEKQEKRDANRKLRRMTRQKLRKNSDRLPSLREVSDVWAFGKDGKCYDPGMTAKDMRK